MLDFGTEKDRLLEITEGADHRLKRDQWLEMKRVLDAIQKRLAPIQTKQRIGFGYMDLRGGIHHLKLLLEDMKERGFVNGINDNQNRVTNYGSSISFLVTDTYAFEDYRKLVSNFYHEVEEDGIHRFPSHYLSTIQQWYQLNQLPIIQYNSESGVGNTNGQEFKLKDGSQDYLVFNELFSHVREKVGKQRVLEIIGRDKGSDSNTVDAAELLKAVGDSQFTRRKTPNQVTATNTINDIAKSIRKKIHLDERQLVQNEGNLTLLAEERDI